jgi:bifunctional DNA-binding transcriptional regulator/antitoxin component of YhaV-PrlF toxin-antitoxin module
MSSTEVLTVKESGDLTLPAEIVERYQIEKEMQFRIIETQKGVLLIPLTDEPMGDELNGELEEWQAIGTKSWDMFEYVESPQ